MKVTRIKTLLCVILAGSLLTVGCDSSVLSEVEEVQKEQEKEKAQIQSLQDQLTALSAALDAYKKEIDPDIAEIENTLKQHLASLQELSGKITAAENAIEQKADKTALQKAINDVTAALTQIQEKFGQDLGKVAQDLQTVAGDLDAAEENLATLSQNLTALQGTVNTEINNLKTRITNVENAIKELKETTIPNIEALIEDNTDFIEEVNKDIRDDMASALDDLAQKMVTIGAFTEFKDAILTRLDGYEELKAAIAALLADYDVTIDGIVDEIRLNTAELALLKARVQSLVFVPQYKDLKFGIPFSAMVDDDPAHNTAIAYNPPDSTFEVVYQVAPDSLAKTLAEYAKEVFTFAIKSDLQTRKEALPDPKLTILSAKGDSTGLITFKLYHTDFEATIASTEGAEPVLDSYAVALRIDDEEKGVHISSEYTGTINVPSPRVVVDMNNVYVPAEQEMENKVRYTKTSNEYQKEIEYIDGEQRQPYDSCYLAAKVYSVKNLATGPYSYPELKKLGFNVPQDKVTITDRGSADCKYLIRTVENDENNKFHPVDTVNVNVDSLYLTKKHLLKEYQTDACTETHKRIMTYTYDNGIGGTLPMKATITLGKANHLFFNVYYAMNWDFEKDRDIDHAIIANENAAAYARKNMKAYPKLIKGEEEITPDGSNAAYGIVASDFSALAHTNEGTIPSSISEHNYTVGTVNPVETIKNDTTIVLTGVTINSWGPKSKTKTADTLDVAGKYALPYSKISDAKVVAHVFDRERKPIDINIKNFEVVLLGGNSVTDGGLYQKDGNKAYLIKSDNLADSVYNAYIKQEIFTAAYTKNNAFGNNEKSEFYTGNVAWWNKTDTIARRFDKSINNTAPGGALYLVSNDTADKKEKLSSELLKKLARNYDGGEDKSFTYSVISYIGQQVNLNWSVTAKPKDDYKFTTYGAQAKDNYYYFELSPEYVWGDVHQISKARTEIDLIKHKNVQIVTGAEGTGGIAPENYAAYGLVPKFQLKYPLGSPVKIEQSLAEPKFLSNVKYYAQVDSVAVLSSMYINSDGTEFLVPGSNKLYFNSSTTAVMDSVLVRKYNPIADAAAQTLTGSAVIKPGTKGSLPLNMVDRNGNMVYKHGKAQNNVGNYVASIQDIFGNIKFSIESVKPANQAAPSNARQARKVDDWNISEASCPELVSLYVPSSIAIGEYQVVVKASTVWKDYTYTFNIYVGDSEGSIEGNNHDYGNGGDETWN